MLEGTSGVTPVEGGLEVLLGVAVLDSGVSFFAKSRRNRGSYMSAHVLLNLLYELGKRDEMRGLPKILSLFRNELIKFNKIKSTNC